MVSRKLLTLKNTTEESNMNNQLPRQGSAHVRFLVEAAVIAALYTVLTYLAVAMNLAYYSIQFRFSEALTILPVFTPAAIPGLALGCFLSNLASPLGIVDWVFGTLATLLAAMLSYALRNIRIKGLPVLASLPPVLTNVVIVGFELACLSDIGLFTFQNFSLAAYVSSAISVGAGELVICVVLGLPLFTLLKKVFDRVGYPTKQKA